jgi:hypothetical protein
LHATGPEQQTSLSRVSNRSLNAKPDISVNRNAAGAVSILDQAECLITTPIVIRTTSDIFHGHHCVADDNPGVSPEDRRQPAGQVEARPPAGHMP